MYLHNENDEQVDDETFFDDKYVKHSNNSHKRHPSPRKKILYDVC